jgi:hypothetical protein
VKLEHESDEETSFLARLRNEDPTLTSVNLSQDMVEEDNEMVDEWMAALQNNRIVDEIEFEFSWRYDDELDYSPIFDMIRTRSQLRGLKINDYTMCHDISSFLAAAAENLALLQSLHLLFPSPLNPRTHI